MFYVIKNADKHFKFEFVNVKQNEYLKKNDFFFSGQTVLPYFKTRYNDY